jgi:acetylornithine/succinyldiaminopimelate/putrescine aminotransferase
MEQQYYAQTVRRQPVLLVRGQGCRVWGADGKEYLDLDAGWAVNNLGHAHPVELSLGRRPPGTNIRHSTVTDLWLNCSSSTVV